MMSRDRDDLDAKRRQVLERIADAILDDKSSHKKLKQILDTMLEFKRLKAEGQDVRLCDGGLILIPGRGDEKHDAAASSVTSKKAVQLATKTYVKLIGVLVASLMGWFVLSGYCELNNSLSAAQVPPRYFVDVYDYCRLCDDE